MLGVDYQPSRPNGTAGETEGWYSERMRLTRALTMLAPVAAIVVACSPFESTSAPAATDGGVDGAASADGGGGGGGDGAAACAPDACTVAPCRRYDFESGCPDWRLDGDTPAPSAPYARDCLGKKLHLAADDTHDATATVDVETPSVAFAGVRVGARVNLADWDGGVLFGVAIAGKPISGLKADTDIDGSGFVQLCDPTGCGGKLPFSLKQEHVVVLDVTEQATKLFVDCREVASRAGGKLVNKSTLTVTIGHVDGVGFDGTFDDVTVVYR